MDKRDVYKYFSSNGGINIFSQILHVEKNMMLGLSSSLIAILRHHRVTQRIKYPSLLISILTFACPRNRRYTIPTLTKQQSNAVVKIPNALVTSSSFFDLYLCQPRYISDQFNLCMATQTHFPYFVIIMRNTISHNIAAYLLNAISAE